MDHLEQVCGPGGQMEMEIHLSVLPTMSRSV